MRDLLLISVGAILTYNFVLVRFLGICPFLGVSKSVDTSLGMGMAVTFVMTLASVMTYLAYVYLLVPFGYEYLQTVVFILIIAALVQFVEMFLQKTSPALYSSLGIYLPLITTNCAVLGVALLNVSPENNYNFLESVVFGASAGLGFTLAIVMFAGVRERLSDANIPKPFRGIPIALISASLLAIAFLGFSGLKF